MVVFGVGETVFLANHGRVRVTGGGGIMSDLYSVCWRTGDQKTSVNSIFASS